MATLSGSRPGWWGGDALLVLVLLCGGAAAGHAGARHVRLEAILGPNVWFQADIARVYPNMTERHSDHYRTKVHPVFSLATHPPVVLLRKAGLSSLDAVHVVMAVAAGLWLATLFVVLRLVRLPRVDALLFSLLGAASAASWFWTTVPETYVLGSWTMLVVMGLLAASARRDRSTWSYLAASALSLSMTVTNWMVGILATFVSRPARQAVRITVGAFLVVTVFWAIQRALYPTSEFFLMLGEETQYVLPASGGGILEKATAFFLHSMVMPAVQILENPWSRDWPFLSIQQVSAGSSGTLGIALIGAWGALLAVGAWATLRCPGLGKFRVVLGLTILGQLGLHLLYGNETFLYAMHYLPFLVLLASMAALTRLRRPVLMLAVVLTAGVAFNNYRQFSRVTDELRCERYGSKTEIEEEGTGARSPPDAPPPVPPPASSNDR